MSYTKKYLKALAQLEKDPELEQIKQDITAEFNKLFRKTNHNKINEKELKELLMIRYRDENIVKQVLSGSNIRKQGEKDRATYVFYHAGMNIPLNSKIEKLLKEADKNEKNISKKIKLDALLWSFTDSIKNKYQINLSELVEKIEGNHTDNFTKGNFVPLFLANELIRYWCRCAFIESALPIPNLDLSIETEKFELPEENSITLQGEEIEIEIPQEESNKKKRTWLKPLIKVLASLSLIGLASGIGAIAGALIGTFAFPGLGTALGAGIGGAIGSTVGLGIATGFVAIPKLYNKVNTTKNGSSSNTNKEQEEYTLNVVTDPSSQLIVNTIKNGSNPYKSPNLQPQNTQEEYSLKVVTNVKKQNTTPDTVNVDTNTPPIENTQGDSPPATLISKC